MHLPRPLPTTPHLPHAITQNGLTRPALYSLSLPQAREAIKLAAKLAQARAKAPDQEGGMDRGGKGRSGPGVLHGRLQRLDDLVGGPRGDMNLIGRSCPCMWGWGLDSPGSIGTALCCAVGSLEACLCPAGGAPCAPATHHATQRHAHLPRPQVTRGVVSSKERDGMRMAVLTAGDVDITLRLASAADLLEEGRVSKEEFEELRGRLVSQAMKGA